LKLQTVLVRVKPKLKPSKDLKLKLQLSARIAANRCNAKAKVEIFQKGQKIQAATKPEVSYSTLMQLLKRRTSSRIK